MQKQGWELSNGNKENGGLAQMVEQVVINFSLYVDVY